MADSKAADGKKPAETTSAPGGKPAESAAGKPVESASAAPGEKRSASRPLGRASESGDPAVHKALADLQTAQMNAGTHQDTADAAAAERDHHRDEVAKAKGALRELGYE